MDTSSDISLRSRPRTLIMGYLTPTNLIRREDHLTRRAREAIPGFERLDQISKDEAIWDVYEDFVYWNRGLGSVMSTASSLVSFIALAPVVKNTELAMLKRPPQSLLGHATLYLVSFSATVWMIRSVTVIGGKILIILFTTVPKAVTKVGKATECYRERVSNGEQV